jgi:hypothetical protein
MILTPHPRYPAVQIVTVDGAHVGHVSRSGRDWLAYCAVPTPYETTDPAQCSRPIPGLYPNPEAAGEAVVEASRV